MAAGPLPGPAHLVRTHPPHWTPLAPSHQGHGAPSAGHMGSLLLCPAGPSTSLLPLGAHSPCAGQGGPLRSRWLLLHCPLKRLHTLMPMLTPSAKGCPEHTGKPRQHTGSGGRPCTIWTLYRHRLRGKSTLRARSLAQASKASSDRGSGRALGGGEGEHVEHGRCVGGCGEHMRARQGCAAVCV